jgi:tetratricopeptide (TPR) repeat protein
MKGPKLIAAIGAALAGIAGFVVWIVREEAVDPLVLGVRAYGREDWRSAEARARLVLKTNSSDPHALRLLARASARRGRDESAEAIYRRLGTKFMEAEDFFLLGRGLLGGGQVGPALASLGAARDLEPDHAETLDTLSHYWVQAGSMTDAVDAAERLRKQPGWQVRSDVRLGRLRAQLFDPAGAASVLTEALLRDPQLAHADLTPAATRMLLARAWLQSGRPAEARAVLEDSAAPGQALDPEGWWLKSRAYLQESRFADALSALKAANGFNGSDPLVKEPAPFLGAERCARCHRSEFRSQQSSRHSRTLLRTTQLRDLPWPEREVNDPNNRQVKHQFHHADSKIEVVTEVGNEAFRAVVEFAMGSNHHGQSFLAREENGQIRELRIAHYPGAPEWDRTMEHPLEPPDVPGYLGRPISAEAFRKCIHCHSTNFRAVFEPDGRPEARDHGIGCERCHGPGGHHPLAIAASFPEPAIARPRLASASRIVALCGECHTAPAKTTPEDPSFVRYQASGLILSRCYVESRDRLSCVSCHDPHQDLETSAASYEATCRKCHTPSRSLRQVPTRQTVDEHNANMARTACPVNAQNGCLDCHMPRLKNAVPRTEFTDHQIRVRHN